MNIQKALSLDKNGVEDSTKATKMWSVSKVEAFQDLAGSGAEGERCPSNADGRRLAGT